MPSGWVGSTRKSRLPDDWPKIREAVFARDGHRCRHIREDTGLRCNAPATDVDHIKRGDDHRIEALQALCAHHHQRKSSQEGGAASYEAMKRRKRNYLPPHPGILR